MADLHKVVTAAPLSLIDLIEAGFLFTCITDEAKSADKEPDNTSDGEED